MNNKESIIRQAFSYKNCLEAYAFSIIHDWGLAEDAVQEALIQVNFQSEKLDSQGLLNWMKKVTHNKSVDIIRRRKRNIFSDELINAVNTSFERQLDEAVAKKDSGHRESLDFCMRQIDKKSRKLMKAFYYEGMKTEDLGEQLGRSANSIRIQIHRIRESLRRCVARSRGGLT